MRTPAATREPRPSVLVVCEGEQTEYRYFMALRRAYRLHTLAVEAGAGQTLALVEVAIRLRDDRRRKAKAAMRSRQLQPTQDDEIWCVFDREGANQPTDFHQAVQRAEREGLALAISNPAFEYWYLVHVTDTDRPLANGAEAKRALEQHIPGYHEALDLFARIGDRTVAAIERAERCYERHPDRAAGERFPNPSTLVFQLVRRLIDEG